MRNLPQAENGARPVKCGVCGSDKTIAVGSTATTMAPNGCEGV